ncbi:zinc finger protein 7-like [Prosopis cineraria]|uniref:zinc finger protein 7-like n=1 Tax=Prosopis cineraria TaxID=364024 RepID=UPI00240FD354|nr:zinc finger protein 7-like [Prosopis cineraria]
MSDRLSLGDAEQKNLKRKMTEESISERPSMDDDESAEELLTLKLMVGSSSGPTGEASNNDETTTRVEGSDNDLQRKFSCKFCNKKFHNSQALGGHQNAHRRERVLNKIDKEFEVGTFGRFGPHFCPYSTMAGLPFTGSPFYPGLHHHMNPLAARYGLQGPANSAPEAFRFGTRSSWAEEGAVQRRANRRNNVRSTSPASTRPGDQSAVTGASGEGFQRNSYTGSIHGEPSSLDLTLSL